MIPAGEAAIASDRVSIVLLWFQPLGLPPTALLMSGGHQLENQSANGLG